MLEHKGYECFYPIYWEKRRWSDRYVQLERLLFPGYVFWPRCEHDFWQDPTDCRRHAAGRMARLSPKFRQARWKHFSA
jgi:hypothetical protein